MIRGEARIQPTFGSNIFHFSELTYRCRSVLAPSVSEGLFRLRKMSLYEVDQIPAVSMQQWKVSAYLQQVKSCRTYIYRIPSTSGRIPMTLRMGIRKSGILDQPMMKYPSAAVRSRTMRQRLPSLHAVIQPCGNTLIMIA